MTWRTRHDNKQHFKVKRRLRFSSSSGQNLNLPTSDPRTAEANSKILLRNFNESPNHDYKLKIKRAIVSIMNRTRFTANDPTLSNRERIEAQKTYEIYKSTLTGMKLPLGFKMGGKKVSFDSLLKPRVNLEEEAQKLKGQGYNLKVQWDTHIKKSRSSSRLVLSSKTGDKYYSVSKDGKYFGYLSKHLAARESLVKALEANKNYWEI